MMKNIVLALAVIIGCMIVGSALGNVAGGFIVGVVLAIMLGKRNWNADAKKSN